MTQGCRVRFRLFVAIAGAAFATGCGKTEVVRVDGSSTVFPISSAIVEDLREVDPSVNIVVSKSGTGGGFKKFAAGEINICNASREMTADEAAACNQGGVEYEKFEIAFDGLAVLVNPANDWCDAITTEQLKTIWRQESEKEIEKWSDVHPDWPEEPLKLYGPGTDSGTYDYFTEVINGKTKSSRQDYSASEDDNALVTGVAGDKGALGYFGLGYYEENKDKLKLLAVDAGAGPIKPTAETVRDGTYAPLARPLYIYVSKASLKSPGVRAFVKHYVENAEKAAPKVGYVAVTDEMANGNREKLAALTEGATAPK